MKENKMIDFFVKLEKFAKKEGVIALLKSRTCTMTNGAVEDSIGVEFMPTDGSETRCSRIRHGMTRRLLQVAKMIDMNARDLMEVLDCSQEDLNNLHRGRDIVDADDVYKFCIGVMSNTSHRISSDYILFGAGNAFNGNIPPTGK